MKSLHILLTLALTIISVGLHAQPTRDSIDSLLSIARYDEAIRFLDSNLITVTTNKNRAHLQLQKAEILILQGNLAQAEAILHNLQTEDDFIKAVSFSTYGFLSLNKGRYDRALEYLQSAQVVFRESGNENSREGILCLAHLAAVYLATGKYKQAEENELMVLQHRQKLFGENSEDVAASYNNLGLIYLSSNPASALLFYDKALAIYKKIHGHDHAKIAIANTNLGITFLQLKSYEKAITHFDTAKKIWDRIYPGGHPNIALLLRNQGRTYNNMKYQNIAVGLYQKALTMYKTFYGSKHPEIASTYNELGLIYLNRKQYDLAIETFQLALTANCPTFNDLNIHNNPARSDYYNPSTLVYSLHLKAQGLEARYVARSLRLPDLKTALSSLYTCDSLLDEIRHQRPDEEDKLSLGTLAHEVYEDGVRIAYTLSENVWDSKYYLEQAFFFAERSKSAVLQEAIADARAKQFSKIPIELIEQERVLKSEISTVTRKLSEGSIGDDKRELREQLFVVNNHYYNFIQQLEINYPEYYNLKYNQSKLDIVSIQNELTENSAVLSYFMSAKVRTLYAFVITKKDFRVKATDFPDDFERTERGFRNSLVYGEPVTFNRTSWQLAQLIIPHLSAEISNLIIVPSESLNTLPFEALLTKRNNSDHFNQDSYLINRFNISYEFSTRFVLNKSDLRNEQDQTIFLMAPVNFASREELSDLPGTEHEVNSIAELFNDRATSALYADAQESLVKLTTARNYRFVHFATHGVVDESNPESSRILLNPSSTDDGYLYAGEIYNLQFNADLTVLSACKTGVGKISKGEGVMGLSRALVYAGTKNLMVSYWSVSDASTAQFMVDFYSQLLQPGRPSFASAMQQAKLKMIRSAEYTAPYYWAPFILIGK